MLVADGVAQGAGLISVGLAFLIPEQVTTLKVGKTATDERHADPCRVGTATAFGAVGEF